MQMVDYKVMNKYPDKNAILSLEYNITSNYRVSVSQIIVDNVIYDVSKKGIDTYVVDLDVGATARLSASKSFTTNFSTVESSSVSL